MARPGTRQKRGSSPKLITLNNALVSALSGFGFEQARKDHSWCGRLIENAVGAHMVVGTVSVPDRCFYLKPSITQTVTCPKKLRLGQAVHSDGNMSILDICIYTYTLDIYI